MTNLSQKVLYNMKSKKVLKNIRSQLVEKIMLSYEDKLHLKCILLCRRVSCEVYMNIVSCPCFEFVLFYGVWYMGQGIPEWTK